MHKLMEYICEELEELERKAEKDGKLSMAEIEYIDKLTHIKKNLLKAEEMWEDSEYSNAQGGNMGGGNNRYSYARGGGRGRGSNARRDSRGRYSSEGGSYEGNTGGGSYAGYRNNRNSYGYGGYSREDAKEDMMMQLQDLEQSAPDEESKQMIRKWMKQVEER